ncbi:MAG: hypothetical protein ACM3S1_13230 [Hyphomicrobiales bacterium]
MTEATAMTCPDCGTAYEPTDNYCRRCGMYLAAVRPTAPATVGAESRAVEPVRPGLPAPVKKAATALAIGTALQIGVGLAGKYLAAQSAPQAVNAGQRAATKPRRKGRDAAREETAVADPAADAAAVSETVLIRRVWIRRGG